MYNNSSLICPIMSNMLPHDNTLGYRFHKISCHRNECAWWSESSQRCAITELVTSASAGPTSTSPSPPPPPMRY